MKIVSFGSSLSEKQPFTFGLFLHLKILLNSITYSVTTRPFGDHYSTNLQPLKIFAVLHVFLVPIISCYDELWGLPRRVFTLLVFGQKWSMSYRSSICICVLAPCIHVYSPKYVLFRLKMFFMIKIVMIIISIN